MDVDLQRYSQTVALHGKANSIPPAFHKLCKSINSIYILIAWHPQLSFPRSDIGVTSCKVELFLTKSEFCVSGFSAGHRVCTIRYRVADGSCPGEPQSCENEPFSSSRKHRRLSKLGNLSYLCLHLLLQAVPCFQHLILQNANLLAHFHQKQLLSCCPQRRDPYPSDLICKVIKVFFLWNSEKKQILNSTPTLFLLGFKLKLIYIFSFCMSGEREGISPSSLLSFQFPLLLPQCLPQGKC